MNMQSWNKLCRVLSEEISENILETEFEREIIYALDSILGWDRFDNVLRQVPIQEGSSIRHIDILVREKNANDLFVIEVKRPIVFIERHDKQLKSYMLLRKLNLGILIGNKIQIYFDNGSNIILIDEIEFIRDSKKGFSFVENFHKQNFSKENIQKYIQEKLKEKEDIKAINKLKNELLSQSHNKEILSLIKNKFLNEYSRNVIDKVLEDLEIYISEVSGKQELNFKGSKISKNVKSSNFDTDKKKIGRYVWDTFQELVNNNLISNDEVIRLQQESYSKLTFDIQYPFLKKVTDLNTRILHYWKPIITIRGESYLICSEWYENHANNDRPYYENWLKKIKKGL